MCAGFEGGQAPWQPHALHRPPCACEPVTSYIPFRTAYPIFRYIDPHCDKQLNRFAIDKNEEARKSYRHLYYC